MRSVFVVVAVLVAAFLVIDTGLAIKCFVCNSYHQADCADWFDNVTQHLTACDPDYTMCRKVVQEVYYEGQWDVRFIRQCAKNGKVGPDEGRICREKFGTYNVRARYCHCDNQDGCNSAPTGWNLSTFFTTAIVTLGYFLHSVALL